jgi:hypothetical protein
VFAACGPEDAPVAPGVPRDDPPREPAGAAAPVAGFPTPIDGPAAGDPGSPCDGPDQCATGFCIPGPGGTRCAAPCSDLPCPDGTVCTETTRTPPDVTMVCLPSVLDCPGCLPDGPGSIEDPDPKPVALPDPTSDPTPDPPDGPPDRPPDPGTPRPTTAHPDLCGAGRIFFQDACVAGPREGCRLGVLDGNLYAACNAEEPVCWDDSTEECEAWGGHLVVINDEAESAFVKRLADGHRAWIGLEERPEAAGMGWILPSDHPPEWCEGEVEADHGPDEWCVAINGGEDGCWKAYDCVLKWHGDSAPAFVCERPGQVPGPGAP